MLLKVWSSGHSVTEVHDKPLNQYTAGMQPLDRWTARMQHSRYCKPTHAETCLMFLQTA